MGSRANAPDNEHEIHGFYSVTLWEAGYEQTAQLLTQELG